MNKQKKVKQYKYNQSTNDIYSMLLLPILSLRQWPY